eukprot:6212028-Pleurochrysis_carterae.AAC.1
MLSLSAGCLRIKTAPGRMTEAQESPRLASARKAQIMRSIVEHNICVLVSALVQAPCSRMSTTAKERGILRRDSLPLGIGSGSKSGSVCRGHTTRVGSPVSTRRCCARVSAYLSGRTAHRIGNLGWERRAHRRAIVSQGTFFERILQACND